MLIAASCGKGPQGPQGFPPVSVTVQPVTTAEASYYDEYPAIVRALNEVELRAQVNGYITAIHFQEGDQVKKGQKLYSIDQQQYRANYEQAEANLAVQEANLEKARKDVERYRELQKNDAIAKQQVDYAEAAYAAAEKQVAASRAAIQGVQTNVRYSTIVAPFDGTIGISQVRLGASISAGQTLLNTISSDSPIAADITVDQKEIFRFTQLYRKKSAANDSTFRLSFSGQVYPAPGKISIIDRAVDAQTGTIRMRLTFPNADHTLRPGMSATLKVLSAGDQKTVVIPHKAVGEQLGEFFVYVTKGDTAVTQRKVIVGKQVGTGVIVRDGLKEGDTIVTEGIQNLREGSAINIAKPAAPAPTANK
jgi:membrane fusion protein, multidrug efflux system